MQWSYGITTVPSRVDDLFPTTLASLAKAGFANPHIFVDGARDSSLYDHLKLNVTTRWPAIRTVGNWLASLLELYVRQPNADRYALFQDDLVSYTNLRSYLEACEFPKYGYWNLFTFPPTQQLPPPENKLGWYPSNQRGRGALALIFNRDGVLTLLRSQHFYDKMQNVEECLQRGLPNLNEPKWLKGQKSVDGSICTAFEKASTPEATWTEYIHNPSLVQHIGNKSSSMRNIEYPLAPTFRGEDFDPLTLLSVSQSCVQKV